MANCFPEVIIISMSTFWENENYVICAIVPLTVFAPRIGEFIWFLKYENRSKTHRTNLINRCEAGQYFHVPLALCTYCMGIQLHLPQHFFERWRHQPLASARSQLRGLGRQGYLRMSSEVFGSPLPRFGSTPPPLALRRYGYPLLHSTSTPADVRPWCHLRGRGEAERFRTYPKIT